MDLDFNKLLPKISESDLRREIRKEYPSHALDFGTLGISQRAYKPG